VVKLNGEFSSLVQLAAAERPAHQPPQAHRETCQNANDLARAAVGCMGVFGGTPSDVTDWGIE